MGVVNKVLPHDELMPFVRERMLDLVPPRGPWQSVRQTKAMLQKALIEEVTQALDRENVVLNRLFSGADFQEALTARLEKRDPVFRGE